MTKHRNCEICGDPIILVPSANERAKKYGESPKYYLDLFTAHADCKIRRNREETKQLMERM